MLNLALILPLSLCCPPFMQPFPLAASCAATSSLRARCWRSTAAGMASGAALTEASQSPAPVAHQTLHATALPALTSVSSDAFTVRVTKPTEEVQRIDGWKNQYSRGQFGVGTCSLLSSSHLPSGQAACRGLAAQSGRAMHDPRSASQFQAPACGGSGGCRGDDSVTPIRTAKECRPLKC